MTTTTPTDVVPSTPLGAHLLQDLDLTYGMVCELADQFDEATARSAPAGHMPLLWFLGHLTCSKDYVSTLHFGTEPLLSLEFYELWADDCSQVDFSAAPSLAEMYGLYHASHQRLRGFVAELTPEDLRRGTDAEIVAQLSDDWKARLRVVGSAISLIQMHDGYHCGQLGSLCSTLGMRVPF
ncbi:DinB family protein [Micromonospora sp. C31]|uniref:DinB family protein n=1 Tax=Micromonospora sp. C31 TaxID=2824876 RepID=UPI001B3831A8|nr:DinB family protein [Micromonospora sp. C31]MBQ1076236.1 DinB family protein [Micromonospora sp. C31]